MMDKQRLQAGLPVEGMGEPLYVFSEIDSTNDMAKGLAEDNAPHGTLVVADAQSSGRGRKGRTWYTEPGTGIALSVIMRPSGIGSITSKLTALGALAVVEALAVRGLEAWVKWPNDVIVPEGKLAGVLVETSWRGDQVDYAIIGIGVNVHTGSFPAVALDFPATCVDDVLGIRVEREALLIDLVRCMGKWLKELGSREFVEMWERHLAYLGQRVAIQGKKSRTVGRLQGLDDAGRLMIRLDSGKMIQLTEGDLSLRPIDSL